MALFIRPQVPTLINSSHAVLKSCTPNLSMTPPKTDILKNILVPLYAETGIQTVSSHVVVLTFDLFDPKSVPDQSVSQDHKCQIL